MSDLDKVGKRKRQRINYKTELLDFLNGFKGFERRRSRPVTFEQIVAEIESAAPEDKDPIVKLFEHADSNYKDLRTWYALIGLFASFFFSPDKRGGKPRQWKRPSNKTLLRDFRVYVRQKPRLSARSIAVGLKKKHPIKYAAPESTIVRWVGHAGISMKKLKRGSAARASKKGK